MTREEIIRNLKYTMEKHKNDRVDTFGTNISVMCKDILDYLEQEPCEDCISRAEAIKAIEEYGSVWMEYTEEMSVHQIAERALKASKQSMYKILHDLPSIQPTTKENLAVPMSVIEDIKAEIEEQVLESLSDGGDDWFTAEKVNECLEIIDKHISGKEQNDNTL